MKALSQCSFIASFVLVVSLFDGLNAAKPVPNMLIQLGEDALAVISKASGKGTILNKLSTLIQSEQAECQDLFAHIVAAYNSGVSHLVIPETITSKIPAEILNVICVKSGSVYTLNSSVLPTITTAMEVVKNALKDEIVDIKAGNGCSCCSLSCCRNFWTKKAPNYLETGVEYLGPILVQIADAYLTKSEVLPTMCSVQIPLSIIKR